MIARIKKYQIKELKRNLNGDKTTFFEIGILKIIINKPKI